MQAINLVVQRLTVIADIRRHSWGTHGYRFQEPSTKTNFWILWEQIMGQNQTNPRCITNLPNALRHCSCFSTEKLCYSATLSAAERRHPKDDVQISDVHAVDSKHMQSIETTLFKLNLWQIQSGVKHYFTNSTYVNKHVLKSTCYFQPTWACDCHHARESKPTPTPPFWRLFLSACKFGASVDGFFGQNLLGWMQSSTGYLFTKKHGHKHTIFWRQRIWSLWIFDWIFYTTASVLTPHSIRGVGNCFVIKYKWKFKGYHAI